jgi:hypothetical protein
MFDCLHNGLGGVKNMYPISRAGTAAEPHRIAALATVDCVVYQIGVGIALPVNVVKSKESGSTLRGLSKYAHDLRRYPLRHNISVGEDIRALLNPGFIKRAGM